MSVAAFINYAIERTKGLVAEFLNHASTQVELVTGMMVTLVVLR
jgi:hypothetical protein